MHREKKSKECGNDRHKKRLLPPFLRGGKCKVNFKNKSRIRFLTIKIKRGMIIHGIRNINTKLGLKFIYDAIFSPMK